MLKQPIEQYVEDLGDATVPVGIAAVHEGRVPLGIDGFVELNQLESALAESEAKYRDPLETIWCRDESCIELDGCAAFDLRETERNDVCAPFSNNPGCTYADKALSDIAKNLTARSNSESFVSAFVSQLARIFGGGLRTVW